MESKKWSIGTWLMIVGPLLLFLGITVWVAEQLINFPGWQLVPYIAVPMAVIFLIIGAIFRAKWGKFIFG